MMAQKLCPLPDAIDRIVKNGSSVVIGAGLEPDIPFCAVYEIIRQAKRDLRVIAPISEAASDMLIGAGCVGGIIGAWVGNMLGGLGYNYRRAVEQSVPNAITISDYSNLSLGMALFAGANGLPYVPMRSLLGSDIVQSNDDLKMGKNPFNPDEPVVLVPPLIPDVAIIAVQRADEAGNCHHWGSRGLAEEAALGAETVIIIADEIVDGDVIASDPSRVLVPGHLVSAVCHVPAGIHPAPMTGRWQRDNDFFDAYRLASRDRDGFLKWLVEWVLNLAGHDAYLEKLGDRIDALKIKGQSPSAPANYAAT